MFKVNHKIFENKDLIKSNLRDEDRVIDEVIEFQFTKILNELKTKKITNPETPCIEESINVVLDDMKNYKKKYIDKRKILAGENFYEYKINHKAKRYHFYKKRNNGKYISIRDYFEAN